MQDTLFPTEPTARAALASPPGSAAARVAPVQAAPPDPAQVALATRLPPLLRLGTSSWTFPGWTGLVWGREYTDRALAKKGLAAYAQHPLLRSVSLDRAFYRPLSTAEYAAYAAQVPADFRFVVKAPSAVTDAMVRNDAGRALQPNPLFLDAQLALREFAQPALDGLGRTLGALVFQLSPLPPPLRADLPAVLARLRAMLSALPDLRQQAPGAVVAVQVRDPAFLRPEFAAVLRETGATYCLGLHARMPPIEDQLPLLRALWPGPLVCRWNLHRRHGAYGYEKARDLYAPYDRIADADPQTRRALAKVIAATCAAGHSACVTIGNKAEGCAPLSVLALAEEVAAQASGADST